MNEESARACHLIGISLVGYGCEHDSISVVEESYIEEPGSSLTILEWSQG
jgi:hypothetical protein